LLTRLKDVYVATGDSGQASPTAASVLNLITNGARDRIVPAREFRPGAAERRHGSFVTYTKANKIRALGVPKSLLAEQGAVCRDVAAAMATGALTHSPADVAVSIGVAGPDPDEDGNPVGRVCIGVAGPAHSARLNSTMGISGTRRFKPALWPTPWRTSSLVSRRHEPWLAPPRRMPVSTDAKAVSSKSVFSKASAMPAATLTRSPWPGHPAESMLGITSAAVFNYGLNYGGGS
jgi:hypothetical protein